jgi:hypothetical protein
MLFFINVWLIQKIFSYCLEMINQIPSGIMKWIGGGHDPLGSHVANEGEGFTRNVMGRGESAFQAGVGSAKDAKERTKRDAQHTADKNLQKDQIKASQDLTNALINKGGSEGGNTGCFTSGSGGSGNAQNGQPINGGSTLTSKDGD